MTSSFLTGKICNVCQETIELGTEKSKPPVCSIQRFHCMTARVESRDSVEHFVLTFFRDQLPEVRHDLVPSSHHGLHFGFGQVCVVFAASSLASSFFNFSNNCRSQRTKPLGFLRSVEIRNARVKSILQSFQSSPMSTFVRLGSES